MIKTQTFVSPENWYSLEYPRTWEMEVIDGIPCFFDGILGFGGALQILSAKIDGIPSEEILKISPYLKGETLSEKLSLFLSLQGARIDEKNLQLFVRDQTDIAACEYRLDGHFFLTLMAERSGIFVLALYNCKGEPIPEEAAQVSKILQSLAILK